MFENVTLTLIKIILSLVNNCFFHSVQEGFTKLDYLYTIYFYMLYKKLNHTNPYNNTYSIHIIESELITHTEMMKRISDRVRIFRAMCRHSTFINCSS